MSKPMMSFHCFHCGKEGIRITAMVHYLTRKGQRLYCSRKCSAAVNRLLKRPALERFEERFTKTPTCWEWNNIDRTRRYGRFMIDGAYTNAHRASYRLYVGQIPAGLNVLHRCDNPACVRPDHLFLGTQLDNMRDCSAKGRARPKKGVDNIKAKLSEEDVREIRRRWDAGIRPAELLQLFPFVKYMAIMRVGQRETWRHLPEEKGPTE